MVKSKETGRDAAIGRLRARLEAKGKSSDSDKALRAQVDFYGRLRDHLAANGASSGLEALDDVALGVLTDDGTVPTVLTDVVTLLPPPDAMQPGEPPSHSLFAPSSSSKRPATRSASKSSPPSKKRRTKPSYTLELPDNTPRRVRADVEALLKKAEATGKAPYRLAYPWDGKRAWYDPAKYPDLHLQHYRFWMKHRPTFFNCALYAPTDKPGARRKQKSSAIQARLRFISSNIETFGYFGFLERLENGSHDTLFWFGGNAASHSSAAKASDSSVPAQVDLVTLYKQDRSRYDRTLARVLDKFKVDEDGYKSVTEILERTGALDPSSSPHRRLSDTALARVAFDASSKNPPSNPNWVGNKNVGVWKRLTVDRGIRATQASVLKKLLDGTYTVPEEEKPFKTSEQGVSDSDFEDAETGKPKVLPPDEPLDDENSDASVEAQEQSEDEDDEDDGHGSSTSKSGDGKSASNDRESDQDDEESDDGKPAADDKPADDGDKPGDDDEKPCGDDDKTAGSEKKPPSSASTTTTSLPKTK
ncbi:hypothetical protein DVH05_005740 [Phytophthora capsici]|nr:hypothetical protein DVH05_005740 [Phytophthora capsici]